MQFISVGFVLCFWFIAILGKGLNLYMDTQETYKLLGIKAELYYVREGIVNDGALQFEIPVPYEISELYFVWQNLRTPMSPMAYKMAFSVSDNKAMTVPFTNISTSDTVPTQISAFQVTLLCTNEKAAEVLVTMQLNISILVDTNVTVLNFKRRKNCNSAKDQNGHKSSSNIQSSTPKYSQPIIYNNPASAHNDSFENDEESTSSDVFYIAVGCACSVILLIALGVAGFYITARKGAKRGYTQGISESSSSQALTQQTQLYLRADTPNNISNNSGNVSGASNPKRVYRNVNDLDQEDVDNQLREIEIDRDKVEIKDVIIEGTFGKIMRATIAEEDEEGKNEEQQFFVKTITDQAREDQILVFLTQCCMLQSLSHENLNPVIRTCLDDSKEPLILYQYSDQGNLKKFLNKCRVMDGGSHYSLSTQQRVYMAIQLIRATQYLHRKRVLHRDIATRNCFIDSGLMLKLCDNALSRDLFPSDYDCLGDNENRPVKWLSLEALIDKKFSPASDIWSFGVTLWELMTLAQLPYADIDPLEMADYLREGYRIPQPVNCPDELYSVMSSCWLVAPQKRPKLSHLITSLTDFYTALGRFV